MEQSRWTVDWKHSKANNLTLATAINAMAATTATTIVSCAAALLTSGNPIAMYSCEASIVGVSAAGVNLALRLDVVQDAGNDLDNKLMKDTNDFMDAQQAQTDCLANRDPRCFSGGICPPINPYQHFL